MAKVYLVTDVQVQAVGIDLDRLITDAQRSYGTSSAVAQPIKNIVSLPRHARD